MKIKIYTTDHWFKKNIPYISECISKAKVTPQIEVVEIKLSNLPTFIDKDGATKPDWTWLKDNLFETGYNAVCLHITRKERDRFGLTHPDTNKSLGGSYHVDNDNVLDFLVIADKRNRAYGYDFDNFTRIFLHELAHGFDHWSFGLPNINVHEWDYERKQIHNIFALYEYDKMSVTRTLRLVLVEIIRRLWR